MLIAGSNQWDRRSSGDLLLPCHVSFHSHRCRIRAPIDHHHLLDLAQIILGQTDSLGGRATEACKRVRSRRDRNPWSRQSRTERSQMSGPPSAGRIATIACKSAFRTSSRSIAGRESRLSTFSSTPDRPSNPSRVGNIDHRRATRYLEMTDRTQFRPASPGGTALQLVRVEIPCPELNRFLYAAVGFRWWWSSRLSWDYARWLTYLDRPDLETWVAYVSGTPAGYFELERQQGDEVELAYFGLLPRFVGVGLGGQLVTAAIARAWNMGATRVWVHTNTRDHPRALLNYQARGFRIFRREDEVVELPDEALQPWPGANVKD